MGSVRRGLVIAMATFALAGCSSAASPGARATPTQPANAATPGATRGPSDASPSTSATADPCAPPNLCDGRVVAGVWQVTVAEHPISVELGAGWTADVAPRQEGVQLLRHGADLEGLSINEFHGTVYGPPCNGGATPTTIGTGPQDLLDFLADRVGLTTVAGPTEVTVGGHVALELDVTAGGVAGCETTANALWQIGRSGDLHLEPGESARFIALDASGQTLVITLESFSQAGYDELLVLAGPVLASMTIS